MFFGSDNDIIKLAAEAIRNDEIVAIPTETVYGLAANALSSSAVKKIFKAKGRPSNNPLIVHIADKNDLEKYAYPDERAHILAKKFWPGPLTIVLPKKDCIPDIVSAELDTVAIRMPNNELTLKIIKSSGVPIAAPSANLSGSPSPTKASHVFDDYNNKVDEDGNEFISGIVDGGDCGIGIESTVISLCGEHPVILRPGYVTYKDLKEILPDVEISSSMFKKMNAGEKALSPGLLHKHYAPKAETVGVIGSVENASKYINLFADENKKQAVMCFDGEETAYSKKFKIVSYGNINNSEEMAKNIFDILRNLDKQNIEKIFIRLSPAEGVGMAVYNRLIRACDFNIINTDKKHMIIGITGPSGAGKGSICKLLEKDGFYHIDTDQISREVVPEALSELTETFGNDIVDKDGILNRKKLAEKAFANEEKTNILNSIMHKRIMKKVDDIAKEKINEGKHVLVDGAALFEAKGEDYCDIIIAISAPYEMRVKRVAQRDGIDEAHVRLRFSRQLSDTELKEKSNLFIINDGNLEKCKNEILKFIIQSQ